MPEKVKARWVGTYAGVMRETGAPLDPGSVHEVYPHEAYGQTQWQDPQDASHIETIGYGQVAKAEHAGIPKAVLEAMGYQFIPKSENWEPVEPLNLAQAQAPEAPPAQMDLSAFAISDEQATAMQQASLEPPADDPEAVEAGAVVEMHKDEGGQITVITTSLEQEAAPPEEAEPPAEGI